MVNNCEGNDYRESIHAGSWYPGSEQELTKQIGTFLEKGGSIKKLQEIAKAIQRSK